jgi:hypothetical protein
VLGEEGTDTCGEEDFGVSIAEVPYNYSIGRE